MRQNFLDSKLYIEELRRLHISPKQQLIDVTNVCEMHRKLSAELDRKILKASIDYTWRIGLFDCVNEICKNPENWTSIQVYRRNIESELISILEKLKREYTFSDYGKKRQYQNTGEDDFHEFSPSPRQIRAIKKDVISRINKETQPQLTDTRVELPSYLFNEVQNYLNEAVKISFICDCDLETEFLDAKWCITELNHFTNRMKNRKTEDPNQAFTDPNT